jgi:short-subunit dehydrogenase
MQIANAKIVLIGAAGGIGAALAYQLDLAGARLLLVGRNAESLKHIRLGLSKPERHSVIDADITSAVDRANLVAQLNLRFAQPDVVIQCAAVSAFGALQSLAPAQIEEVIQTNLAAPILLTQALLPHLNPAGARLLMIGSSFGGIGYPGFSAYCASKFGLRGFSEALRRELADGPHQVAYLAPRATKTALNSSAICEMNQALGNAMDAPELVAQVALQMLLAQRMRDRAIGMPERLFLKLNALFPALVDAALRKQLATIKSYFQPNPSVPAMRTQPASTQGESHV